MTDDEVAEFCEYWAALRDEYKVEGKEFAAWNASKRRSAEHREAARRGLRLERRVPR
jgi:hypothetical protein